MNINKNRPLKVVINTRFGGFSLSEKAREMLGGLSDMEDFSIERHNPKLVEVVEKLGDLASGDPQYCVLKIYELSGIYYYIENYDGSETVIEPQNMIDASIYKDEANE